MKRFASLALVALVMGLASCTDTSKPVPINDPNLIVKYQVIRSSASTQPVWVNQGWTIAAENSAQGLPKMVYFTVQGTGLDQERAGIDAETKKVTKITELLKAVATREFAVAKQGMLNDTAPIDAYYEETIAVLSKNVDISGIVETESYWEYVAEQEGNTGPIKKSYLMWRRYQMDYTLYVKALTRSVEQAAKKVNPELQGKAQDTLKALNAAADKMTGETGK